MLSGKNFVGSVSSGNGNVRFKAVDPKSSDELDTWFYEASESEVNEAVNKATAAFDIYRAKTNEERAHFLETIADEIMALGDALIKRCMAETALPEGRLIGERGRTVGQLRLFASVVREASWKDARIDPADPERKPFPKPDVRQLHIPLGPVGIFGASNFPLAFSVAGGDTASALAAGCPVVVKAHPLHPGTSELVSAAILSAAHKCNMPNGVFSMLHGQSTAVGMAITTHKKITAIGFTGSFKGGKAIFDAAAGRACPIPVFAEMGSSNPLFILPGAIKEEGANLAKGLTSSLTLGVGQFCTNPGLVVIPQQEQGSDFIKILGKEVERASPGIMLSKSISSNYLDGISRLSVTKEVVQVAKSTFTGGGNEVEAYVFKTDAKAFIAHGSLDEEIFGPATLGVLTNTKEEILNIAESLQGHLTATIHGTANDLTEYKDLVRILERKVGRVIFNGFPTGVEVCHAMVHGGPYPATTASQSTSVGTAAIRRFARPVCYQDFPQSALPEELKNENPLNMWRLIDGERSQDPIS